MNKDFPNDGRFALDGNPIIRIDCELIPGVDSYGDIRARIVAAFERQFIAVVIARHNGNLTAASKELQMDRKYLYQLVKKHNLRQVKSKS